MARSPLVGTLYAVASASAFGVTIVVQRSLAREGLPVAIALGIRFGIAAVLLFATLAVLRRPLAPVTGERIAAALLGTVGYASEAGLFYLALARGSAGAVSLVFYAYPVLVVLGEAAVTRTRVGARTVAALALSSGGIVLVVVAGTDLHLSPAGLAFALSAATCFSAYLIVSTRAIRRSPPMVTGAWVAGGATLALLATAALSGTTHVPGDALLRIGVNGVATAVAFGFLWAALGRLGAGPAAVVMTMEAFVAVALGAVTLHERVAATQLAGGAAIIAAAILVTRAAHRPDPAAQGAALAP